jgi:hypothetical protein
MSDGAKVRRVKKRASSEGQLNVDVPVEVADAVKRYADEIGWPRKRIVELALRRWFREQGVVVGKGEGG